MEVSSKMKSEEMSAENKGFRLLMLVLILAALPLIHDALIGVCAASPVWSDMCNETGDNYIKWVWTGSDVSVYVDGELKASNYNLEYWIASNLNPRERHRIDIIAGETHLYNEAETLCRLETFYLLAFLAAILMLLTTVSVLFGITAFLVSLQGLYTLNSSVGQNSPILNILFGLLIVFSCLMMAFS